MTSFISKTCKPAMLAAALICATIIFAAARANANEPMDAAQAKALVVKIADRIVEGKDPASYPWNWGENLLMRGLIRASEVTGDERYFEFVEKWLDRWTADGGQYYPTEVDGTASAFSSILAYEKTGNKQYLQGTRKAAKFLAKDERRMEDGAIIHRFARELWLDTLYMITPYMAHLAKIKGDGELMTDAANQILLNASHTQNPQTHLSYHKWNPKTGPTPAFWARGNGWTVMASVEVLELLPEDHPKRPALLEFLQNRCAALAKLQDESGLWHTVLDRPDSYLEVSASAMFSFAMQRGAARGWLPEEMMGAGLRALPGIASYVQEDGTVLGVSGGTDPGDIEHYQNIKTGEYTWGTGAALLALSELAAK